MCTEVLTDAGKRKPSSQGKIERSYKAVGQGSLLDLSDPKVAVVTQADGTTDEYQTAVCRAVLVDVYRYSKADALSVCFGFALDPRPRPGQRMRSRVCGGDMNDSNHFLPKGYTFALKEKYNHFKKTVAHKDFR